MTTIPPHQDTSLESNALTAITDNDHHHGFAGDIATPRLKQLKPSEPIARAATPIHNTHIDNRAPSTNKRLASFDDLQHLSELTLPQAELTLNTETDNEDRKIKTVIFLVALGLAAEKVYPEEDFSFLSDYAEMLNKGELYIESEAFKEDFERRMIPYGLTYGVFNKL